MSKIASVRNDATMTLDERIAEALTTTDQPSDFLLALYNELDEAVGVADTSARECRARSVDPLCRDGIAERGRAEDQEFISHRLKAAATPLREKYQKALVSEAQAVWNRDALPVELMVVKLAREFLDVYPEAALKLADLFHRIRAANREVANLNNLPISTRTLRRVEVDTDIVEKVKLPTWSKNGVDIWPPKPMNVGLEYSMMVTSMLQSGGGVPVDPVREGETARDYTLRQQQKNVAASERQMEFVASQERGREQKNAEALARSEAHAAEQRRLAAGELPR